MKADPYPARALGVLSALAVAAFVLSFSPLPEPGPLVAGALILVAVIAIGLELSRSSDLGAPLLAPGPGGAVAARRAALALALGLGAGAALGGAMLLAPRLAPAGSPLRADLLAGALRPVWRRWLVACDTAILEEILFRLFLVSFVAWILARRRLPSKRWSPRARAWVAIVLVAIGDGLAHLPTWRAETSAGAGVLVLAAALGILGGALYGALYWRRGIETAIAAHCAAGVVLHVLGPGLF